MNPQLDQVVWLLDGLWLGSQQTLEDVGQMPDIELVVEVHCSLPEVSLDLSVQSQCCLDNRHDLLLDGSLKLGEMLA